VPEMNTVEISDREHSVVTGEMKRINSPNVDHILKSADYHELNTPIKEDDER
jgi:hypothetical protein